MTLTPGWPRRAVARCVLATFTTTFGACGGSPPVPSTTTTTSTVTTSTTEAPVPTTSVPVQPPTTLAAAPAAEAPPPLPAQAPQQLGRQELRTLVAPVALYPDVVLASLLPATTFPDQIHDAAQSLGTLRRVDEIPADRGWDGSVTALLQFPEVTQWLDDNPAWTEDMGQAVTYQQADVLQAIQDYRHQTADAGNLKTNRYQRVSYAPDRDIRIEPARRDVVYVPSYDPAIATQPQPTAESAPINPWIVFGGGAVVGALGAWALYSIFHHDRGGNGGRRIQTYNNYYYGNARRARPVDWTPRQRAWRPYRGEQRLQPLKRFEPNDRPARPVRALRPPPIGRAGLRRPDAVLTRPAPRLRPEPTQPRQQSRQARRQERRQERVENRQRVAQPAGPQAAVPPRAARRARREQRQERRQQQQRQAPPVQGREAPVAPQPKAQQRQERQQRRMQRQPANRGPQGMRRGGGDLGDGAAGGGAPGGGGGAHQGRKRKQPR